jgi:hypothetical protein
MGHTFRDRFLTGQLHFPKVPQRVRRETIVKKIAVDRLRSSGALTGGNDHGKMPSLPRRL